MVVEWCFVISSRLGLHARVASLFVQTALTFAAEIEVEKEGHRVNGKSVMGILTLVAGNGSAITLRASGSDAEQAVEALSKLVQRTLSEHLGDNGAPTVWPGSTGPGAKGSSGPPRQTGRNTRGGRVGSRRLS